MAAMGNISARLEFWGSLKTPCLKIRGSLTNLQGQNFLISNIQLLYADDLAVIADSLEECIARLKIWKEGMEHMELRVDMKEMKIMVSGPGLDLLCD